MSTERLIIAVRSLESVGYRLGRPHRAPEDSGLPRAAELYTASCGEDPEHERLWIGLFRVYECPGDLLGLGRAERQLRQSLVEVAPSSVNINPDTVTLPPKLDRLLQDIRLRLSDTSSASTPV